MYNFDPKTGVLILQGKWTAGMFRKLIAQLGITNITQIIVDDYAYLSVDHMNLTNIIVARTGYFTCAYCNINGIDSKGVVRARYSILTEVSNDGQLYLTCRTHAHGIKCFRHLNLSQCFVSDLHCFTHASVKATSSYIAASDATASSVLCLGSSIVVNCTGLFSYWARPSLGCRGFGNFTSDMQLQLMVIEVLCKVDYIDSTYTYTDPRLEHLVIEIAKYLNNNVTLVWDLAREFGGRIEFPTHIKRGKKLVLFNTDQAKDNLVKYAGTFQV